MKEKKQDKHYFPVFTNIKFLFQIFMDLYPRKSKDTAATKNFGNWANEKPNVDAYDGTLLVLFDLERNYGEISKDFINLLKNVNSRNQSIDFNSAYEDKLTKQIEDLVKSKKDHEFTDVIENNDLYVYVSIQLKCEEEDAAEGIKRYVEITGTLRYIYIDPSSKWLNDQKDKDKLKGLFKTKDRNFSSKNEIGS